MGICSCTAKFLLFVFNLICFLVGVAILSSAVYFYLQSHTVKDLVSGYVSFSFIMMMVLGAVIVVVSFLGCCGAVNEDPCCISTYATLLLIILICQLVLAGIFLYVAQGDQIEKELRKELEKDYSNYDVNAGAIDTMQTFFKCCGYSGPESFRLINLPASCCPKDQNNSGTSIVQTIAGQCNFINAYKEGCASKIVGTVKNVGRNGSITLFVVGGVELLCIVAAFCIASSIRRERVAAYAY